MLSCLLLASQLHAASVAWYLEPVVVDPHPVRYSYWVTYNALYVEKVTGLRASPVFRQPMAASTVYYALWDASGEQPYLEEQTGEQWRDMAFSSASIAAEALLWETLDRSPELGGAVRFMRTFVSPNLELKRHPEGWRARANEPDIRLRPSLERQELQEGMFPTREPPLPTIRLGTGLDIEDLDSLTERERTVDAAAWLRLTRIGLDQVTVRGLLLSQTWEISGRKHLGRGLSLAGATSSLSASALPEDWGAGVSWNLPGLRWWTVLLRYRRDLRFVGKKNLEWNLRLTLRWLPPAKPPVLPGAWPLGQRVAAPGPVRPAEPEAQPCVAEDPLPEPADAWDSPQRMDDLPRRRRGPGRTSGSSAAPR